MLDSVIKPISDPLLVAVCLFFLGSSIFLSFKLRFIQIRLFPFLFKYLKDSLKDPKLTHSKHTFTPFKALFTSMSTTIGIASIVAPVIAIKLGGPGALLGFLLTAFFGGAATFLEVNLSVLYRKKLPNGQIMGGPMQYLEKILSVKAAKWYAICALALIVVWSAAQANQLAAILSSPSLGKFQIPPVYSGVGIATLITLAMVGGARRIGDFSAKLVPIMFILYTASSFWIIGSNLDQIGRVFHEIISSSLAPQALASGSLVGGIFSALRWGIFKGVQTTEVGLGTQTIPHSMVETANPKAQGALAMFSTFSAGGVAFISGFVTLITETWKSDTIPLGINMVVASYEQYFSVAGFVILSIMSLLFGFGTILGNTFNGSQCFGYLRQNKNKNLFLGASAIMIFLGALGEVKAVWSLVDIVLCFMAIPHMLALLKSVSKVKESILSN
jgi:alanine or glycine:cation symporter, AGCS family